MVMPLPLAGSKADAVSFFRVGDDDLGFSLVAVDDGFFLRLGQGIADLSKAGELGLYGAYSLIKQYSADKNK